MCPAEFGGKQALKHRQIWGAVCGVEHGVAQRLCSSVTVWVLSVTVCCVWARWALLCADWHIFWNCNLNIKRKKQQDKDNVELWTGKAIQRVGLVRLGCCWAVLLYKSSEITENILVTCKAVNLLGSYQSQQNSKSSCFVSRLLLQAALRMRVTDQSCLRNRGLGSCEMWQASFCPVNVFVT